MRVFQQNELPFALSFLHNSREDGVRKVALILMKPSNFDGTLSFRYDHYIMFGFVMVALEQVSVLHCCVIIIASACAKTTSKTWFYKLPAARFCQSNQI